jgi:hypothetical protein
MSSEVHGTSAILKTKRFSTTLVTQRETKVETLPAGAALWRAQFGCEWEPEYQDGEYIDDMPQPLQPKRMIPLQDRACELVR